MRDDRHIKNEIKKLRLVTKSKLYSEEIKTAAWNMMLALQWTISRDIQHDVKCFTPTDLCGVNMDQSNAIKKLAQRERRA